MIKHTPGPFSIGQDATDLMDKDCRSENSRFVAIDAPGHGALAIVVVRMEDDEADNPRLMGNLSLFAAAPDLLAALQRAIDEAVADDFDEWYLNARQIIAKATGGTQ